MGIPKWVYESLSQGSDAERIAGGVAFCCVATTSITQRPLTAMDTGSESNDSYSGSPFQRENAVGTTPKIGVLRYSLYLR
jgi:hypothetical protein